MDRRDRQITLDDPTGEVGRPGHAGATGRVRLGWGSRASEFMRARLPERWREPLDQGGQPLPRTRLRRSPAPMAMN